MLQIRGWPSRFTRWSAFPGRSASLSSPSLPVHQSLSLAIRTVTVTKPTTTTWLTFHPDQSTASREYPTAAAAAAASVWHFDQKHVALGPSFGSTGHG
jgi:hypothetical protein